MCRLSNNFLAVSLNDLERHFSGLRASEPYISEYIVRKLAALHSGRTPVFDRRTFLVPRLTCKWRVTNYVGKTSAIGQPTRPTQPFILSGSINWVVSWSRCAPPAYVTYNILTIVSTVKDFWRLQAVRYTAKVVVSRISCTTDRCLLQTNIASHYVLLNPIVKLSGDSEKHSMSCS